MGTLGLEILASAPHDALTALLWGYVFGSVPSGLWLTKIFYHIDIREYGSHNIGATNVFRTVGAPLGVATLVCDVAKAIVPCMIVDHATAGGWFIVLAAAGAILGHSYSLFLGFKGGKGVATGVGLLAYMEPLAALAGFVSWAIVVALTRYVSLGSIVGACAAAGAGFALHYPLPYALFGALAGALVIIRHRENIQRLLNGTESKIKPGKFDKKAN